MIKPLYATGAIISLAVLVQVGSYALKGNGTHSLSPDNTKMDQLVREEQLRDDITYMLLKSSARIHLDAVRTNAKVRPDEMLAHDIIVYAAAAKPFWRKTGTDPTNKLADLREAMDGLRPLDGPRVSCPNKLPSQTDQRCLAYFKALHGVFGRDI